MDDDGFASKLVPIRAKVTIAGDQMTIDLGESSPQVEGFINSAYANTRSLAHAAIMYLAPVDVARNEGSMRPVKIVAPRGLVVNANPPAPVCMSTNHCAEEVVEAVFKALAPGHPQRRLRRVLPPLALRYYRQRSRGRAVGSSGISFWPGAAAAPPEGMTMAGPTSARLTLPVGIRSPSIEVTEERFPLFRPAPRVASRIPRRERPRGAGAWARCATWCTKARARPC